MPASSASREFATLAAGSFGGAAGLAAVGAFPTQRIGGEGSLAAMAVGIGISLAASLVAAIPLVLGRSANPAGRQAVFLGAMSARMVTTLVLFAVLVLCNVLNNRALALWTGLSYLVLLMIETMTAIRLMRRREVAA